MPGSNEPQTSGEQPVSWLQRYRIQLFVRNSLWLLPAVAIVAALISVSLLTRFEGPAGSQVNISVDTGRIIMSTVAASLFSLVILVSSAVLLAVQLASAQLTPRIIAMVYRNTLLKLCLALFVFSFTFSVAVLVRIEDTVPRLASYIAAYGFLIDIVLFVVFIDRIGKTLRPSSAVRTVGLAGREVIRAVYPSLLRDQSEPAKPVEAFERTPRRVVTNNTDGAVLAFDLKGLVQLAQESDCVIEMVPRVGNFIAAGDPLFWVYGDAHRLTDSRLRNSVAVDQERTLEQDPMFAFRIIVDIASKALSPAINDPTTAVLAIDQLHHLLREVGKRYLAEGYERDSGDDIRVVFRTPDWEDFVQTATTEIRQYGGDSIQVQRRLRAMLKDLIETLPAERASVLQKELALLKTLSTRAFPDLDDQSLAQEDDPQGIGGSSDETDRSHTD